MSQEFEFRVLALLEKLAAEVGKQRAEIEELWKLYHKINWKFETKLSGKKQPKSKKYSHRK